MKKSLSKKFGIYSALGVAGGMTFGATSAEADIIFTDFTGTATTTSALSIDMDGDSNIDFIFDFAIVGPNPYGSLSNWARVRGVGGIDTNAFAVTDPSPFDAGPRYGPNNLAFGATISGQSFGSGTGGTAFPGTTYLSGPLQMAYSNYAVNTAYGAFGGANFPSPASGYVGVRFQSAGGDTVFGWIGVTVNGTVTNAGFDDATITVDGFAYATKGTRITAGQRVIPEPSSVGLLALGAAGLAARRRKSKKD